MSTLTQTSPQIKEDWIQLLEEANEDARFEEAHVAATKADDRNRQAGIDCPWTILWGAYREAFGVADRFSDPDGPIDKDAYLWRVSTYTGINPF